MHRKNVSNPEHTAALVGQIRDGGGHLGGDLRCVGSPGAQHELDLRIKVMSCRNEVRHTLLAGDAADEGHHGFGRVDAEF